MSTMFNPWSDEAIESKPKSNMFNPWADAQEEPSTILGEIPKGLKAGVQQIKGMGYGIGALASQAVGSEAGLDWAKKGLADVEASTPKPAVASYKDVNDLTSAAKYLAYGVASNAPNMALSIGGGGIGALVGGKVVMGAAKAALTKELAKKILAKGVARGAMTGAAGASIGMEAGSIAGDQLTETGKVDPLRAVAGAVPAGLLDVIPEWYLAKKLGLFGGEGRKAGEGLLKYIGKTAAQQFAMEAPTEAMQSVIERASVPGKAITNQEAWDEYINSFILGGATGAVMGGGAGIFAKKQTAVQKVIEKDPLSNDLETQLSEADPEGLTSVPAEAWDTSRVPVRQPSPEPPAPAPVRPATETNVAGATLTSEEVALQNMQRGNVAAEEAKVKQAAAQNVLEGTAKTAEAQKGYASEAEALMSIQARRLDPKDFNIQKAGNRWTITPKSIYEGLEETEETATPLRTEVSPAAEEAKAPDYEAEAERLGIVYNGTQERINRPPLPMFTDNETKSTFTVDDGETIEGALQRTRAGYATTTASAEQTASVAPTSDISPEGIQGQGSKTAQGETKAKITGKAIPKKNQMGLFGETPSFSFANLKKRGEAIDSKQLIKAAIETYGTTDVDESIGFLTRDGVAIDSSGKTLGSRSEGRNVDHREIAQSALGERASNEFNENLNIFMNETGSIRVKSAKNELNIDVPIENGRPSNEQLARLGRMARGKTVYYDLSDSKGRVVKSGEGTFAEFLKELPSFVKGAQGKATKENVQAVADSLMAGLKNVSRALVYANVKDANMPIEALDAMYRANGIDENGNSDVAGMVWDGQIYLFSDNISSDLDVIRAFVKHEMFHKGFQTLFKNLASKNGAFIPYLTQVNTLLDNIWTQREADVRKNTAKNQDQLKIDSKDGVERTKARRKAAEEWLAHQAPESEPKLFDRLVAIVRNFLRQIGFDTKLSDAEIRTVIADSYAALRGEVPSGIKNAEPVFAFDSKSPLGKISGHARSLGSRILAGIEKPNPRVGKLKTQIASHFAERSAKVGVIDYRENSPKENRRVEKYLREFFDVCMAKHPEALEWYRKELKETFDILAQLAPELVNKENRFIMNLSLAIASNGEKNIPNVKNAYEIYQSFQENRVFLSKVGSRRGEAIEKGLKRADALSREFNSLGEFEAWLLGKVPRHILVDEVAALLGITRKEALWAGDEEDMETVLPRSVVFGPKVGGAFFPNLSGDFDTITMDMWFMRTIGRITGDLLEGGTSEEVEAQRERLWKAIKASPEGMKIVRKDWAEKLRAKEGAGGGERLFANEFEGEETDIIANIIAKLSGDKSFREKLNAVEGGEKLRTAANNRNEYISGPLPKDAPKGEGKRAWLRERINNVRKGLAKEGKDYDNADIQAIMWIGEKELWKKYGLRQTQGDYYSDGANALYEGIHGRPSELFTGGARRVGEESGSGMEQGALFSRSKQDKTKTERAYGIIGQIRKAAESNPDGFTISISDGTTQKTGYAVAPSKLTETRLDVLTEDDLLGFLNKFESVFNSDYRAFLGGWFDSKTKKFVLDVSFVVDSLEEALYLGENGGQDAIFDITNQNEIRTADGVADLKQRNVYSESKRDALRGVQETLRQTIQGSGTTEGAGTSNRMGQGASEKAVSGERRVPTGAFLKQEGIHYSNRYRDYLDSSAYGTGLKGAEGRRLEGEPDLQDRINFYFDTGTGIKKEPGLGNYAHKVSADHNLYDPRKDSLGLRKNNPDANTFERAIMSNGYDGYVDTTRGVGVLLGKRNIKVRPTTKIATPKTAEEPSFSRTGGPKARLLSVVKAIESERPPRRDALIDLLADVDKGLTGKQDSNYTRGYKDMSAYARYADSLLSFDDTEMYLSDGGYSRIYISIEGSSVHLGGQSRKEVKEKWSEGEEPSFSRASEYVDSGRQYIEAARNVWSSPKESYKYPGAIKRSFEYVFGSPEHSAHPVIRALSRVFEERNGWFNEYFLRFAEGDHPGRQHDTMAEALDSLNDDHYDSFEQIDNDMDVSGYTQDEAREYMKKNKVAPEVVEAWEAKTARFNTVMDTIIENVQEQVDEIDESASMRGAEPSYPRIAYETNAQGEPDTNSPIDLKDYLGVLREMKNYAYSPRIREPGKYVVRAEIPASGRKFMQFAKNQIAAEKLKLDKMAEGWENVEVAQSRTLPESVQAGLKEMDVLKLVGEALNKTNDAAASEAFGAQLTSEIHNIILSRGYRRHQIGRQTQLVEGYETDPRKKVFTYLTNSAAGIAKAKAAKQAMQIMTGGTREDTAEGARTVEALGEYHGMPINPATEGRTYDAAKKYIADNLRNVEDADRAVAFVKKLATFKYLSWTLRAPLVNVTALMTTVAPSIQQYAGQGKAGMLNVMKEIGKASTQYVRVMRGERGALTSSEQAFMDEVNRRQYDDPQMVRDMMTSMQGSSGRTFDNIVQWGMKPFSYVEQWMRGLTMLAGYRVAKQGGMSELDAREAAIKSANNAHGVYGKATRQYWAQGTDPAARIGQVASTFLKFPQNYLNLLYDLGYTKGNIKAFTWALAAPIVLGGLAAIPFKDNIVWMINALLKGLGDDRDIEKMVFDDARKYLGPEAEKNLRTGLMGWAGIDITGSLAMNIGLPTDLLSLTGIFGAMAKETYRAGHFVATQQYSKALETVLPSLPANALRAFREMDGATTMSGKRVWNEDGTPYIPTSGETALRVAGFRGSKRTTTQQRDWETNREKQRWDESKEKIYDRYRAFLADKNPSPDRFKSIMEDVYKYNKAIVARGRVGMVKPIKPAQLKRIVRDMLRQSKTELRMQKVGR